MNNKQKLHCRKLKFVQNFHAIPSVWFRENEKIKQ